MTHSYMVIQYKNTDKIQIFNYKINCKKDDKMSK